ncbi:peroxidase [Citrus sinensis]|nr:peroxidase [Citrus sinensis]
MSGVVSCADILAVAARDFVVAVRIYFKILTAPLRDSTTASLDLANSDLPGPDMSLGELISAFADKGLTAEEMAALSGARTIGQAPTDIDPLYEVSLREKKYASAVSVLVTT